MERRLGQTNVIAIPNCGVGAGVGSGAATGAGMGSAIGVGAGLGSAAGIASAVPAKDRTVEYRIFANICNRKRVCKWDIRMSKMAKRRTDALNAISNPLARPGRFIQFYGICSARCCLSLSLGSAICFGA